MKRNPDQQRMEGICLCYVVKNYLNGNTFPERSKNNLMTIMHILHMAVIQSFYSIQISENMIILKLIFGNCCYLLQQEHKILQ